MNKDVIKNFIIYLCGNFGSKLLTLFLLPFYSIYLTTNEFGTFDLINSYINLLIPIVSLQISDAAYRLLLDENEDKNIIISNSVDILSKMLFVVNLIAIGLIIFIKNEYLLLVVIQLNLFTILAFYQQVVRGYKLNKLYSLGGFIQTLFTVSSNFILIIICNKGIKGLIISNIIGAIICILIFEYKISVLKKINLNLVNKNVKKGLILFSIPLIPNVVSWWVMNLSDRILIQIFCGISSLGIYAMANKIPAFLSMINSIFSLAWQDEAIKSYSDKNNKYTDDFEKFINTQVIAFCFVISITHTIFKIMIKNDFYISWIYVPPLYISCIFSGISSFLGAFYVSYKNTKGAFSTSVVGAVVNFGINIILIKYIGLFAAVLSTMISFAVMSLLRYKDIKKYADISINIKNNIVRIVIIIVMTMLYYNNSLIANLISIMIAIIYCIITNKELIEIVILKIKSKIVSING